MKDPKVIDQESRKKIISDLDHNFFVEAGAGSGKTTVLVERMVAMIEAGKDISKISAITFTKAAANEFYSRFQKRLVERSNIKSETEFKQRPGRIPYPSNKETRQRCLEALQKIDLAFMGTIDSFCNMVMSEHPMEGKIPSSSTVIEDEELDELINRERINILNGNYHDSNLELKAKEYLRVIGDYYDKETFNTTMKILLSHRDVDIVMPNVKVENIDEKFKDEIKSIRKIFSVLKEHENYVISTNEKNAEELRKSIKQNSYIINDTWDDNIPNVLNALKYTLLSNLFRLPLDPVVRNDLGYTADYFVEHLVKDKPKWIVINPDKLPKLVEAIKNIQYVVTLDFCLSARDKILETLRKEGKLSFTDYLIYLRDALKEDANNGGKLIEHIYKRHSYFLLDEFQDTDPIQAEIFFYLSANKLDVDWKKCVPHQGSLFIVGDPKQSIYKFKNADVAAYLDVEKMFEDPSVGEVLNLYCNFRSTNYLKNFFNDAFKTMLNETDEQAPFVDIPVDAEKELTTTKVYTYGVAARPAEGEKDYHKVASIILKLINNEDFKIIDPDKNEERTLDFKDFMLITPGKGSLPNYTKEFRNNRIPYFVEGSIKFKESKALKELTTIFGAITQTKDNRYLYGALKTSIFHINEKDIIEARNNGYNFNVLNYKEGLKISNNLNNALKKLYDLAIISNKLNSSSLFLKLIEELECFKYTGDKNLEYVYFVLELLKNEESSKNIISHLETLNYLEGLLSGGESKERCPGLEKSGNQVHIANLHKVKGLEAPVVILGSPVHKNHDPSFRSDRKNHKGYIFSVVDKDTKVKYLETTCFESEKAKEAESEALESLRLKYVAATRARNILFISSIVKKTSNEVSSEDNWADLRTQPNVKFNDINELLTIEQKEINNNEIEYKDIEINNSIISTNNKDLSVNSYSLLRPSSLTNTDEITDSEMSDVSIKEFDESNYDTLSTIKGTMVHRLMELIINSKDSLEKSSLVNQIINELLKDEFISYKDEFITMLNNVYNTLHNGGYKQVNGAEDNILPILLDAEEVYTEVPFTFKDKDEIYNGIIDLIYKKDNKHHIIDWKTNKLDKDLDKHYEPQLNIYKKAFETSTGLVVEDAKIYHIDLNVNSQVV